MRKYYYVLCFIIMAISLCIAQTTIAVIDFDTRNIAAGETATLTDRFRAELTRTNAYIVVERGMMEEILKEQGFQQSGCTTDECVVEVGQLMGVKQMVGGSIGHVGNIYTVSARIIDVESGEILNVTTYDHVGGIGSLLTEGMRIVVANLITTVSKSMVSQLQGFGSLFITTIPAGAEVWVDGIQMDGTTPLMIDKQNVGEHEILVQKDNFSAKQAITIKKDDVNKINLVLKQITGKLKVGSNPFEAKVFVDGEEKGLTPVVISDLKIGQHKIRVELIGYDIFEQSVQIKGDEIEKLNADLIKRLGNLVINTVPSGAEVIINGMSKGVTPLKLDQIDVGQYELEMKLTDYLRESHEVLISKNESKEININLTSIADVKQEITGLKKQRLYYIAGSAGALAAAFVFNMMANNNYDDYQTAGANATELHKTIDTQLLITKLFVAAGIGSVIPAAKYHIDQSRLKIQLERRGG